MIPPDANAAFVATMEDVLEVYQRPHDPQRPLVCLDETSKQLIIETRAPIPAKPGQPARHDYEYERNGVANLFMVFAPLEGWRHVKVTDRHTAIDYAHVLRDLSDTHFPDAAKIVLVQDNLNIHKPASLYEAFPAPEARRLVERFEWHYTPKHGSWLDMAESELGVLASQCLDRRIADKQILAHEVTAWQDHRNKHHAKADWQFKTANARVKLKRLYPHLAGAAGWPTVASDVVVLAGGAPARSRSNSASAVVSFMRRSSSADSRYNGSHGGIRSAVSSNSPLPPISMVYCTRRPMSRWTMLSSSAE